MHCSFVFFFFNDTATTEIYTLSLHDALPISQVRAWSHQACYTISHGDGRSLMQSTLREVEQMVRAVPAWRSAPLQLDRKSTRLNSSHANISYAVFCLKKKKV